MRWDCKFWWFWRNQQPNIVLVPLVLNLYVSDLYIQTLRQGPSNSPPHRLSANNHSKIRDDTLILFLLIRALMPPWPTSISVVSSKKPKKGAFYEVEILGGESKCPKMIPFRFNTRAPKLSAWVKIGCRLQVQVVSSQVPILGHRCRLSWMRLG